MTITSTRRFSVVAAVLLLLPLLPVSADNGPELVFFEQSVEIDRISRGGTVFLFSASREQVQYGSAHSVVRMFPIVDSASEGTVRYESHRLIEPNGVWIAIDETSGRFTITRAPGRSTAVAVLPDDAVKHGNSDSEGTLEVRLRSAWLLLVRPGEGTWTARVIDGGDLDFDGTDNGRIAIPTGKLQHAKLKEKKAGRIGKDDVLFVIDATTLRVFTVKVK